MSLSETQQQELDSLEVDGVLAPVDVVTAAKPKRSPLHELFTWDNGACAEKWRLHEARMVIRAYVTIIPPDETVVRAYVSIGSDRVQGAGYRRIESVQKSPDLHAAYVNDALAQAEKFASRYSAMDEWVPVRRAILRAVAAVRKLRIKAA